jgi:cellulose synthase/poly-beta-1,6-N-acetylglucosamine synthase-like glycosyltransferase
MNTLHAILWFILIYFVVLHAIYFLLILIGATQIRRYYDSITFAEYHRIASSSLTMPVSVIVPCYNEGKIIVDTVWNALNLNYPHHEVIVVSDGSTDDTIGLLERTFDLRRIERYGRKHILTKDVLAVYESATHPNLVVIDKENGRRPDAINAGVAFSKCPLLCVIDADCFLDKDALLHLARPFLRDSDVAATTGVVRPSNGLTIKEGEIVARAYPKTLLGLNQEVEYARSFQWSRIGLCRLNSMLCISGALMMIKKSMFEGIGGSSSSAITDDIEFTVRLHQHIFDRKMREKARLVYVPDAVCYTEVPEKFRLYASQRNRWQRGTLQALFRSWRMILNPRYGLTGLFGMPFFILFEALAAIVEAAAWISLVVVLMLGAVAIWEIVVALYLAYILNVFISLSAMLLTETTRQRTLSWRDLGRGFLAIFLDNLGFHQFHLVARVVGTIQYIFFRRKDLGAPMDRIVPTGYSSQ